MYTKIFDHIQNNSNLMQNLTTQLSRINVTHSIKNVFNNAISIDLVEPIQKLTNQYLKKKREL